MKDGFVKSPRYSTTILSVLSSILVVVILLAHTPSAHAQCSASSFDVPKVGTPAIPDYRVTIPEAGGVGDGQTMNSGAFAAAIRACVGHGGGTVVVPPGVWLTGPITLASNVNLHLERGSVILLSRRIDDYPVIRRNGPTSTSFQRTPPIRAYALHDVAITGEGIVEGSGDVWRPAKKEKYTEREWKEMVASGGVVSADGKMWWPSAAAMEGETVMKEVKKKGKSATEADAARAMEYLRPSMVQFVGCTRVLVDGPSFRNSPKFTVHFVECDSVTVRGISVCNPWNAQNGDGVDFSSCHNVVMTNSIVDAGDDGICVKPGGVSSSRGWSVACENIFIANCTVGRGHGGFVIGSESYGGARNIVVRNCTFTGTDVGLRFKSAKGVGGRIEDVDIAGIRMTGILNEAILFDMTYGSGDGSTEEGKNAKRIPDFRRFSIRNVAASNVASAGRLHGLADAPLQDVTLENVSISGAEGMSVRNADGLTMKNVHVRPSAGPACTIEDAQNVSLSLPHDDSLRLPIVKVAGAQSSGITVEIQGTASAKNAVSIRSDVPAGSVTVRP